MKSPRLRKALMVFLAFTYLFVGLVHASAHVAEAIPAAIALEVSGPAGGDSDDSDSKKSSAFVEFCQIYAPTLMPVPAPVAVRSTRLIELVFATPHFILADHPWLDTPPPKHLT